MKTITTINPATERNLHDYSIHTHAEALQIIEYLYLQQKDFSQTSYSERSGFLKNLAKELRTEIAPLAELITAEMGKPLAQSRAEIEKCVWVCDYYAENGAEVLKDIEIQTDASKSVVSFRPLGVTLGIMPWNFPFWQVFRFAVPSIMAGNTALLKHASNVCGCSLVIERLFEDAGFPKNVFRSIIYPASAMEDIIGHPAVKTVSITGSTSAGKNVASLAGKYLKKSVLELGGSDPYVVLKDADILSAVSSCAKGRLINGGQSCIAAKRFIVVKEVVKEFTELLIAEFSKYKTGSPMDEQFSVGPLAKKEFVDEIQQICDSSEKFGATCVYKEKLNYSEGYYFAPRIYTNVTCQMPLFREETFGPVGVIIEAIDNADAFRLANDSVFGLGGAVFTSDNMYGEHAAKYYIEAGSVFVNDFVRSDPRLPFGGINESGYGRELAPFGIREFTNIKTVYIK
ncbi:MAG: NAD-dependent succinate-semialdehyde dehydrogenase [Ignavibacteriaceae bacterium]|nr:NAD-dependent succinate-semialdehyde dehydrogenase [Ignavibacteriaceae bacterium]